MGTNNGWVDGAALVFKSKQHTGNEPPEFWGVVHYCPFAKALSELHHCDGQCSVPQLQARAYFYKELDIGKMMDWLSSKGIAYPKKHKKCDIWEIVRKHRPQCPIHVVDEVASQAG